jgi:hypothetical protein
MQGHAAASNTWRMPATHGASSTPDQPRRPPCGAPPPCCHSRGAPSPCTSRRTPCPAPVAATPGRTRGRTGPPAGRAGARARVVSGRCGNGCANGLWNACVHLAWTQSARPVDGIGTQPSQASALTSNQAHACYRAAVACRQQHPGTRMRLCSRPLALAPPGSRSGRSRSARREPWPPPAPQQPERACSRSTCCCRPPPAAAAAVVAAAAPAGRSADRPAWVCAVGGRISSGCKHAARRLAPAGSCP